MENIEPTILEVNKSKMHFVDNYHVDCTEQNIKAISSAGKRFIWTNAEIRTLLRSICITWNGLFQSMLEDLTKEEKRQKTRELKKGWSITHENFLQEYPDSTITARQLAEKFRKLVQPPGTQTRYSIAHVLLLHQGSNPEDSEYQQQEEEFISKDTVSKEIDLETGDNTTAETKNPPKRGARKCKQLNKSSKLAVLNSESTVEIQISQNSFQQRKRELEAEIIQLQSETKIRKNEVLELIRRKLEEKQFEDLNSLLNITDDVT